MQFFKKWFRPKCFSLAARNIPLRLWNLTGSFAFLKETGIELIFKKNFGKTNGMQRFFRNPTGVDSARIQCSAAWLCQQLNSFFEKL